MAQAHRVVSEYKLPDNPQSNIRVYVRARPLENGIEPGDFITIGSDDLRQISIKDPDTSNRKYSEVSFQFDRVFWTDIGQEEIFNSMCKPQVDHVLEGFNTCCFAYGQTGSGKTYSMFGNDNEIRGIIPRSAEYLFQSLAKKGNSVETAVVCSFLEIYNDQIRDLGKAYLVSTGAETSTSTALFNKTSDIFESLAGKRGNSYFASAFHSSGGAPKGCGGVESVPGARGLGYKEVQDEYQTMNYEIHEDSEGNVFVKNLSMVPVTTIEDVMDMVDSGLKVRATHETKMNASSSRSHTVLTLSVLQRDKITGVSMTGMLNLVDLAGSERLKKSESQGVRLKEVLHINTSLSALGKVVMSLDPSAVSTHTPYRDAKLTRVLQNSLGGNSYTIVLAAIHPCAAYYDECLSTLQFANRCRNVRNNPRVNYVDDNSDKDLKLKRMQDELTMLRTRVVTYERNNDGKNVEGKINIFSTEKMLNLLNKMGVSASLSLDDGSILINGEKFDFDDIEFDSHHDEGKFLSFNDDGEVCESNRSRERGRDGDGNKVRGSKDDKYQKMYFEQLENIKLYSNKSKENKLLLQESGIQVQELSKQLVKLQNIIKRHDQTLIIQRDTLDMKRDEERKTLMETHKEELSKLILYHDITIKKQSEIFHNAPTVFKSYTQIIKSKQNEKENYEEPLRKEFSYQISLQNSHQKEEFLTLKKQYEYFLNEKDIIINEFCAKFTSYRNKKKEQLELCEEEIIKLYEYAEKTEKILNDVENGMYKVEQKQGKFGRNFNGNGTGTGIGNFNVGGGGGNSRSGTGTGSGVRKGSVPDSTDLLALSGVSTFRVDRSGSSNNDKNKYIDVDDIGKDGNNGMLMTSTATAGLSDINNNNNNYNNKNSNDTYKLNNNEDFNRMFSNGYEVETGTKAGNGTGFGTGVNSLRGRVLLPKGLRPTNPLNSSGLNDMILSKKIITKYNQRRNAFDKTQKSLNRKTTSFAENILKNSMENRKFQNIRNENNDYNDNDDDNRKKKKKEDNGEDDDDDEEQIIDPHVERHLMELLGPRSISSNLFGLNSKITGGGDNRDQIGNNYNRQKNDNYNNGNNNGNNNNSSNNNDSKNETDERNRNSNNRSIGNSSGNNFSRPNSAPSIPVPLSLRKQQDKFYGIEYTTEEKERGKQGEAEGDCYLNPRGTSHTERTSRTYSISSVRDPAFGVVRESKGVNPLTRSAPWGSEKNKGSGSGSGQMHGVFDEYGVGLRNLKSTGGMKLNSLGSTEFSEFGGTGTEDVRALRTELLELKTQIRVDQHIISGISSNELIQYIQKLEEENTNLHARVRDVHNQLRDVKAANLCIMKSQNNKINKK